MALQEAGSNTGEPSPQGAAARQDGAARGAHRATGAAPAGRVSASGAEASGASPVRKTAETEAAPPSRWVRIVSEDGEDHGEVLHIHTAHGQFGEVVYDPRATAAERWKLKRHLNELLPQSRQAKCYVFQARNQTRQVYRRTDNRRAFLRGFQTCGSPHLCPICGPKISERRKDEVQRGIDAAKVLGLNVKLGTFTIPHGLGDDLGDLLDTMLGAWRATSTGRAGKALRKALDLVGYIRVLETTDGVPNGFHPHFHVLFFFGQDCTDETVRAGFYPLWNDACRKKGLGAISERFGVQVQGAHAAAAYVAKGSWSIAHEMAKGVVKKGREGRYSMMDLLRLSADGDLYARKRFQIFAEAIQGRRHMYWSNGLKKLLGIEEMTDEEIAARAEEGAHEIILASLTDEEWRVLGQFGKGDWSVFLEICGHGYEAARAFIDDLMERANAKEGQGQQEGAGVGGGVGGRVGGIHAVRSAQVERGRDLPDAGARAAVRGRERPRLGGGAGEPGAVPGRSVGAAVVQG